jgi:hypothetical protein
LGTKPEPQEYAQSPGTGTGKYLLIRAFPTTPEISVRIDEKIIKLIHRQRLIEKIHRGILGD